MKTLNYPQGSEAWTTDLPGRVGGFIARRRRLVGFVVMALLLVVVAVVVTKGMKGRK